MESEWVIPSQGYVRRGHVESLSEGRQAAYEWLIHHGSTPFQAEKAAEMVQVEHAWWDEQQSVFVQPHHEGAEPVTVVHIPV